MQFGVGDVLESRCLGLHAVTGRRFGGAVRHGVLSHFLMMQVTLKRHLVVKEEGKGDN